jgi:hypothetical protein
MDYRKATFEFGLLILATVLFAIVFKTVYPSI